MTTKWTKVKPGVYKAEGTDYAVESLKADGPWIIRSKGRKGKTEFKTMKEAKAAVETRISSESIPEPVGPLNFTDALPGAIERKAEARAARVGLVYAPEVVSIETGATPTPKDMSPMPARYRVVFSRIGRRGRQDLGEITIPATSAQPGQDVAFEIHKRIRSRHLLSSPWFEVEADL